MQCLDKFKYDIIKVDILLHILIYEVFILAFNPLLEMYNHSAKVKKKYYIHGKSQTSAPSLFLSVWAKVGYIYMKERESPGESPHICPAKSKVRRSNRLI